MRKRRFRESQIVATLKEGEAGRPTGELLRKHGISAATYYAWKSKYGGMSASDLERMKELEAEHSRLERMCGVHRPSSQQGVEMFERRLESVLGGVRHPCPESPAFSLGYRAGR
jgi:putative transposase